jgi:hypothetical protein
MNNYAYLGVVQNGTLKILAAESGASGSFRLTSILPQAAQAPESGEISLASHEGRALMVRGIDQGGWIYAATVIEEAGPILTMVAQAVFPSPPAPGTIQFPMG